MSSKQELSFSDGESCGSATSQRSSTRCPISASGLLFYNTLYDENAASHIALGQAYSKCFRNGGADFSEDDLAARGANRSLIHIDWMIGSNRIDVDGLSAEGRAIPVMRAGEWVD